VRAHRFVLGAFNLVATWTRSHAFGLPTATGFRYSDGLAHRGAGRVGAERE
jgi:hypothetical protein